VFTLRTAQRGDGRESAHNMVAQPSSLTRIQLRSGQLLSAALFQIRWRGEHFASVATRAAIAQ
jgi:hypothetical protein